MYEEVMYSYYDSCGNFVWCGTKTGVHVVYNARTYWNYNTSDSYSVK